MDESEDTWRRPASTVTATQRVATENDVYSHDYQYDNESSTDDDASDDGMESSDDDDGFISQIGKISTKTSSKGKVKISGSSGELATVNDMENDEEEDDFEAEMTEELDRRVENAEKLAAIARTCPLPDQLDMFEDDSSSSKQKESSNKSESAQAPGEKYDDIYFDSDEDEDEARVVKSNDELLYDPNEDDEDQAWVDDVRRSYQQSNIQSTNKTIVSDLKPLANSDAVLNCPACFTPVCLDCQRHELYHQQYRAMFVLNCTVVTDQKLRFPLKNKKKGGRKKKMVVDDPNEEFHPVKCDECGTEIAMYDKEEIYHFFNVLASHS